MAMNSKMTIGHFLPQPVTVKPGKSSTTNSSNGAFNNTFKTLLDEQLVTFSQHAQHRMSERGIKLDQSELRKIEAAFDKAAEKGAKDSLFMLNHVAFIVNVPKKTVVTAIDQMTMKEHIFTNIDSAIMI